MSDAQTPLYKKINGTALVDKLEFLDGISPKTNNPYLLPTLYLRSPVSDTPIRLEFKYIDPNVSALLRLKLAEINKADEKEFQDGIK